MIPWKNLEDINLLDEIKNESNLKPVVLFKHSTRCIVSITILKNIEKEFDLLKNSDLKSFYFLDLLQHRNISNEIASVFKVEHQSPQILLISNEKCVFNASHSDIELSKITSLTF